MRKFFVQNFGCRAAQADGAALESLIAGKGLEPAGERASADLVVLNTCQHPLDPDPQYHPRPVRLDVFQTPPPAADDACRCSRPENGRAFRNTEDYHALRG